MEGDTQSKSTSIWWDKDIRAYVCWLVSIGLISMPCWVTLFVITSGVGGVVSELREGKEKEGGNKALSALLSCFIATAGYEILVGGRLFL
jgi:hypothetical protein